MAKRSTINIRPSEQAKASMRDLAKVKVDRALRRELAQIAKELEGDIRKSASRIPSKTGDGSLREALVKGTKKSVRASRRNTSISVGIAPTGGKANLARVVEGEKVWKHPVYGHAPTVVQRPMPFFWRVVARKSAEIDKKIILAVRYAISRLPRR